MAVSVPFTGGCACGAIRYECTAKPLLVWKCHCRDCQKRTGSAFYVNVWVPTPALRFTKGEPTYAPTQGESGNIFYRGFCSACGATVEGKSDGFPDIRGVSATSLDDPSGLEPAADIWTSSAQPWDYMNPALPKYEHQPTEEEMQELMGSRS